MAGGIGVEDSRRCTPPRPSLPFEQVPQFDAGACTLVRTGGHGSERRHTRTRRECQLRFTGAREPGGSMVRLPGVPCAASLLLYRHPTTPIRSRIGREDQNAEDWGRWLLFLPGSLLEWLEWTGLA